MKPISTVQLSVPRLGLVIIDSASDQDLASWVRSFYRALSKPDPKLNEYAAELMSDVQSYRDSKAEYMRENRHNVTKSSGKFQELPEVPLSVSKSVSQLTSNSRKQETLFVSGETNILMDQFEAARKLYPGTKRGLQTEWANFKAKHGRMAAQIVPLLVPAIERWVKHRKWASTQPGAFLPEWKNFKTWINGSHWEDETPKEIITR